MSDEQTAFAGYPSAVIYGEPVPGKTRGRRALQHLIWGDWLKVTDADGDWRRVKSRGVDGWLHQDLIQSERLLEVNFVDIGQGDGCLIVTPKDRFILVDAGAGDNMFRFLRWRFGRFRRRITFEAAVITHPDQDHYHGFQPLFEHEKVHFESVYHNGIVERAADKATDRLGPKWRDPATRRTYLTDVVADLPALRRILDNPDLVGRLQYPSMLKTAVESGRVGDIRMLCADDGFMPGYEAHKSLSIQVLGPVPEPGPAGERYLRWIDNVGKTKNGHSVILRMVYRDVSLLLGGDLNVPAEEYLLSHYTTCSCELPTRRPSSCRVATPSRTATPGPTRWVRWASTAGALGRSSTAPNWPARPRRTSSTPSTSGGGSWSCSRRSRTRRPRPRSAGRGPSSRRWWNNWSGAWPSMA